MVLFEILSLCAIIAAIFFWNKLKQEQAMPKDVKRRAFSNDEKIKIAWRHLKEHGAQCAHCPGNEDLDFDHVIPLARGGHNGLNNMQILCGHCNSKKGARSEG